MDDPTHLAQERALPQSLPFRAVLVPHRSLSPRGFLILMALFGGLSFVTGLAFAIIGAWPVLGFFGVDVALVYLAFRLNYRAARATETIEVTRDELLIVRTNASGRRQSAARFSPAWARLDVDALPDGDVMVSVGSHGRRTRIAQHLSPVERIDFARALNAALRLARGPERGASVSDPRSDT